MATVRLSSKSNVKIQIVNLIGRYFNESNRFKHLSQGEDPEEKLTTPIANIKIKHALNIIYTVIFNIDENNTGNKNKMLEFIETLIRENASSTEKDPFGNPGGYFSLHLKGIQVIIVKMMNENNKADFLLPPEILGDPQFAQPIIMLCSYSAKRQYTFAKTKTEDHKNQIILEVLKILMLPRSNHIRYKLLEDALNRDKAFEGRKWLATPDRLNSDDILFFRGNLSRIIKPFIVIRDVLALAGAEASAKELAGLVLDYYRNSMVKESKEIANPYMIVKNQFFSIGAKSTAAANVSALVMEYYDDEEMTDDNENGKTIVLR